MDKTLRQEIQAEIERIENGIKNGDYSNTFRRAQKRRLKILKNHAAELDDFAKRKLESEFIKNI